MAGSTSRKVFLRRKAVFGGSGPKNYRGFDLTMEEVAEFRQAFNAFDRDNNGSISHKELGIVMRSLGQNPTETELMEMINENDIDGNGIIDFDEFVALMANRLKGSDPHEDFDHGYMVFDREKKGYIATQDLRFALKNIEGEGVTDKEIDEIINAIDRDKDDRISYKEYLELVAYKK